MCWTISDERTHDSSLLPTPPLHTASPHCVRSCRPMSFSMPRIVALLVVGIAQTSSLRLPSATRARSGACALRMKREAFLSDIKAMCAMPVMSQRHQRRASPISLCDSSQQDGQYSQAARLREETEAPFAKLRLYLWPALLAAAGLATYFGATSLLAEAVGARQPAEGTAVGLAIDLAAVAAIGLLWRNDLKAQDARLRRISAGARLAALRVRLPEGDTVAPLSELRASSSKRKEGKRVVIICAEDKALRGALADAQGIADRLKQADLLIIPLLIGAADSRGTVLEAPPLDMQALASPVVATPLNTNAWQDVIGSELETALKQDDTVKSRGFALILKKNGRVGTRRLGMPDWNALAADVESRARAGLDTRNI